MTPLYRQLAVVLAMFAAALLGVFWAQRLRENDPFMAAAIPQDKPFPSLTYGIQAFLWWDSGMSGFWADSTRILGFNTIKQTFPWQEMELKPSEWNFAQADRVVELIQSKRMYLVARLGETPSWALTEAQKAHMRATGSHDAPPEDLTLFANYCGTLAKRYAGRIKAYQIWNEPNLSREWGGQPPDATAYVALLKACSQAIRAHDPRAILISAGLAPTGTHDDTAHRDDIYLDAMYRSGFQDYIDVVGAHAPGFAPPSYGPDDAERDGRGRWASFRRVEDLRKIMIQHGDAARQMAILETGYTRDERPNSEYAWFAVTEEERRRYIPEAFAYALEHWRPWIGLMTLIYFPKETWTPDNEEYWWAISTYPPGHLPVYYEIARMKKVCDDYVIPETPLGVEESEYIDNILTCP
ncbi:MAG: cellulase family glycosylhydrolase [Anaerolineae bacterium]|nr:cellulase family glycosylhydrolase [Anaerolineae bacterium]MDW8173418.1 cellulase family glycosylhydrolase [Anaerolineae bacterium]